MLGTFRTITTLACVGLMALAIGACGDDDNEGASPGATSTSSTVAAPNNTPKGKPIVLGSICSCSGAQAAVLGGTDKVVQAWAKSVNEAGGINGHPVKVITQDDGGDPARSLQAAKKLVEQHRIVAMVSDMSLADQSWADYVKSKGIPVVGGISAGAAMLTHAGFYPSGTQFVVNTVGVALAAKAAGLKHFGVAYCAESPVCAQLDPLAKGAARLAGMEYSSLKISSTAPNYTAPCLRLKEDGVDALYVAQNSPTVIRFTDRCAQQNFTPQGAYNIAGLSNLVLDNKHLDGAVLAAPNANPFDRSTPAVQEFQTQLDKHAPGIVDTDKLAFSMIMAWAGGKLFEAAAEAAKLTPDSTPSDVKNGLYALKDETLDGLAPPLNYSKGKPAFIPCYFTQKITDGKFASDNGNKPKCLTAAQSKALASLAG